METGGSHSRYTRGPVSTTEAPAGETRAGEVREAARAQRWTWLDAGWAPWAVIGLALAARLLGLERRSVWFDEAVTFVNARLAWEQFLDAARQDVHPPLSYALYHLWLAVDPAISAADPARDSWFRLPSAVVGALAAPLAWTWARRIAGRGAGLATGLLVACAPFLVDLSQDARMYGLLAMLTAASLLALDRVLTGGGGRWIAAYAVAGAAMPYTHYYGAFLLAAQGLAALLALAGPRRRDAWRALGALAVAGAAFVPWLPQMLAQVGDVREGYWIDPPRLATLWTTFRALAADTPPDATLGLPLRVDYVLEALLLAHGVLLAWRCDRQRPAVLTLVAAPGLALLFSLVVTPVYALRYVSPVLLAFALLGARGALALPRPWLRAAGLAVLFFPAVVSLPPLYLDPGYSRSDLRSAAAYVAAQRQSGDVVVHLGDFTALPFTYYRSTPPVRVLRTDDRSELCDALRGAGAGSGWLVTSYAPDDDAARAAAEAGVLAETYAGPLVAGEPARFLGVSVFHVGACDDAKD